MAKLFVDQSGKVEQLTKVTVVAVSNDLQYTVLLPQREKRVLQAVFRNAGKPRVFVFQTFASLVFLTLKNLVKEDSIVVIDNEYPGHEDLIKNYLLQFCKKTKLPLSKNRVYFSKVGKKSKVHKLANSKFRVKSADKKVRFEEVLGLVLSLK